MIMIAIANKKIGPQPRLAVIHFCQSCYRKRVTSYVPSFYCDPCRVFIWGLEDAWPAPEPETEVAHLPAHPLVMAEVTLVLPALIDGRESVCGPGCAGAETLDDLCLNCYSDHLID